MGIVKIIFLILIAFMISCGVPKERTYVSKKMPDLLTADLYISGMHYLVLYRRNGYVYETINVTKDSIECNPQYTTVKFRK